MRKQLIIRCSVKIDVAACLRAFAVFVYLGRERAGVFGPPFVVSATMRSKARRLIELGLKAKG
jgi:hypothetical protein